MRRTALRSMDEDSRTLGALLLAQAIAPAILLGLAGVVAGILVANWQPGRNTKAPD